MTDGHEGGHLRRSLGRARDWRERVRARRRARVVYRLVIGLLGGAIVLAGLGMVPLPGPGWLVVFIGLAILASEFEWAHRVEQFAKRQVQRWTRWVKDQPWPIRALVTLLTLSFVGAVVYGVAALTGVPSWVPDALVPPLPGLRP